MKQAMTRNLVLGFLSVLALGLVALAQKSDEPGANIDAPPYVTEGQYTNGTLGTVAQPMPETFDMSAIYGVTGEWPTYTPALAPGEGHDAVTSYCSICHSTAYITMSPPMSAEKWSDTVYKMLNTFGASQYIPDEAATQISAYLGAYYTPETIAASTRATAQQVSQTSSAAASNPSGSSDGSQSGGAATGETGGADSGGAGSGGADSGGADSGSAGVAPAAADSAGAQVYGQNCAGCHQADGQGVAGAFPPLADHAPSLLAADGGRTYLTHVLLYGLQGQIDVGGSSYNGQMPAWGGSLSDEQIADVLNYVLTAWNNNAQLPSDFKPFAAADVAAQRDASLTAQQVYEERQKLNLP